MIFIALSMAVAMPTCLNETVEEAARSVLNSLSKGEYSCVHSIITNPNLKFTEGKIDRAVEESLHFCGSGHKSYLDIVRGGIEMDYAGRPEKKSVFFIERRSYKEYVRNKPLFKKKYYMKKYFVCNFEKYGGEWHLTEDFCFTESEY